MTTLDDSVVTFCFVRAAVDNGTASQMPTEAGSFKGEMRGEWRFDEAGWTVDMKAYTGLDGYSY